LVEVSLDLDEERLSCWGSFSFLYELQGKQFKIKKPFPNPEMAFSLVYLIYYISENASTTPTTTIETILINLIRILRLGPDVSLKGSPTVSPTTAAL
jgi:hypothetical protein